MITGIRCKHMFLSHQSERGWRGSHKGIAALVSYHRKEERERGGGRLWQMGREGGLAEAEGDEKTMQRASSCSREPDPSQLLHPGAWKRDAHAYTHMHPQRN